MPRFARWLAAHGLRASASLAMLCSVALADEPVGPQIDSDYVHTTWTRKSGLPSNTINALAQTRDGYLWLATPAGLVRFDGADFVVFNRANTDAMSSDDCRVLLEDSTGGLWISTAKGLVCREGPVMREVPIDGLGHRIEFLAASRSGGIWAAGGETIYRLRQVAQVGWQSESRRAPGKVWGLQEDNRGMLWVLSDRGIAEWLPQGDRWEAAPEIGTTRVGNLALAPDGGLWALSSTGVYKRASPRWEFRCGQEVFTDYRDPALSRDRFLVFDGEGGLWLNAGLNGLDRFEGGQHTRYGWPFGNRTDAALCMLADREGNLWVGCENTGLHQLRRRRITILTPSEGLPHNNTWAVLGASDGSVWIGTDGGVCRLDQGECRTWTEADGLTKNEVRALAEDAQGRIWIGTGAGLNVISDGRLIPGRLPGDWPHSKVRVLENSRSGVLWVGTATGLSAIDPNCVASVEKGWRKDESRALVFTPLRCLGEAEGLPVADVRDVLEDRAGRLWIGTHGGGLACYDQGSMSVLTVRDSLTSDYVWTLHEDAEGDLWVGTEAGLNRLKEGHVTPFTKAQGLPENLVNSVIEDDVGNLWIGHDVGIYRVKKEELSRVADGHQAVVEAVVYDEDDGLLSLETNGQKSQPAACRLGDGRLCFPTTAGVAVFQRRALPDVSVPPQVAVEQIRANGLPIFDNGVTDPHARTSDQEAVEPAMNSRAVSWTPDQEFRLAPGAGSVLEIAYTATAFVAGNNARFRYRLEGTDASWIDAGTSRRAYYANLKPGRYRFHLAARNKHGIWSQDQVVASFQLLPYVYETWWFRAVCATGLVGLGWLGWTWRIREMRRVNRLEAEAALGRERARLAKDLHDGLGADLTHLMLLADQVEAPPTGVPRIPSRILLQSLARSTHATLHTLREILWATHPANDTLESLVQRIGQYAEDFLKAAQVECRLDLPLEVPDIAVTAQLRSDLFYAIKEALHNAVRHARATEVQVQVTHDDGWLRVTIEDDGRGFQPGATSGESTRAGWPRHGLVNMRDRLKALGGRFICCSQPGAGTVVRLEVPLSP